MPGRQIEIAFIPDFSKGVCVGQLKLDGLVEQARILTGIADRMRTEGYKKVTLEMIVFRARSIERIVLPDFSPEQFIYTGKKVIPNEKIFFEWYLSTDEGQEYKQAVDAVLPGALGHFGKIIIDAI